MCAIAGFAATDPRRALHPAATQSVARMLDAMAHRGPDGSGLQTLPGMVLGHRRLAIIDLSDRASQPMPLRCVGADGAGGAPPAWVALNGEIYNYQELRRDLEQAGHQIRSDSDTEVILHLYEARGDRCVDLLRGMFAFALWDAREGRLLLARDRMGKKPLYWQARPEGLVFASELQALAQYARSRGDAIEADAGALASYLALRYVPGPGTALRGFHKLPPASILTWSGGTLAQRVYWTLPQPAAEGQRPIDARAAREQLLETLREAVRIRLRSDVPLGLFLSGGIDSAAIAALMTELAPRQVSTFSVGFAERDYDELQRAARVARALGTSHHEIPIRPTPTQVAGILPELARRLDQPCADSSAVAVWHLAREVRRHVTVALSGDGADELFFGYDRYRAHRLAARLAAFPASMRRAAQGAFTLWPAVSSRRNLAGRARRFLAAADLPPLARNDAWIRCLPAAMDLRAAMMPDHVADPLAAVDLRAADPFAAIHAAAAGCAAADPLQAIQRADLQVWLPDDVLHKVDSMTMAHALEARAPFLDHHVVELAMTLPPSLNLRGGRGKLLLRQALAGRLPAATLAERKAGFGLPIDHWLRGPLAGYARDLLLSRRCTQRGLVPRREVETLLNEHATGRASHEDAIWALMMLEHWCAQHLEAHKRHEPLAQPLAAPEATLDVAP
jgi:asparagine synthase (glutamine-hydrolysing)